MQVRFFTLFAPFASGDQHEIRFAFGVIQARPMGREDCVFVLHGCKSLGLRSALLCLFEESVRPRMGLVCPLPKVISGVKAGRPQDDGQVFDEEVVLTILEHLGLNEDE